MAVVAVPIFVYAAPSTFNARAISSPAGFARYNDIVKGCTFEEVGSLREHHKRMQRDGNLLNPWMGPELLFATLGSGKESDVLDGTNVSVCRRVEHEAGVGKVGHYITRVGPVNLSKRGEMLQVVFIPEAPVGSSTVHLTESIDVIRDPAGAVLNFPPVHLHHSHGVHTRMSPSRERDPGFASFFPLGQLWSPRLSLKEAFTTSPFPVALPDLICEGEPDPMACLYLSLPRGYALPKSNTSDLYAHTIAMLDADSPQTIVLEHGRKYVLEPEVGNGLTSIAPLLIPVVMTPDLPGMNPLPQLLLSLTRSETVLSPVQVSTTLSPRAAFDRPRLIARDPRFTGNNGYQHEGPVSAGASVVWKSWTMPHPGRFVSAFLHTHSAGPSEAWLFAAPPAAVLPASLAAPRHDGGGPIMLGPLNMSFAGIKRKVLAAQGSSLICSFQSVAAMRGGHRFARGARRVDVTANSRGDVCDNWRFVKGSVLTLLVFVDPAPRMWMHHTIAAYAHFDGY